MILLRILLISLIVYLLIRSFIKIGEGGKNSTRMSKPENKSGINNKKISKKVGEYIDYEEIDK